MTTLTWPRVLFQQLIRDLLESPRQAAYARVGAFCSDSHREMLVRDYTLADPLASVPPGAELLRVTLTSGPPPPAPTHWPNGARGPFLGHLYLGQGGWTGQAWGFLRESGAISLIESLYLPGAGMHRTMLADSAGGSDVSGNTVENRSERIRWSRTAAALGGEEVWRRMIGARYAVIGLGRTGSMVAASLSRLGVLDLRLIDPDRLEEHNLGEMEGVREQDLGRPKVDALAEALQLFQPANRGVITALPAPISDPAALASARECDVICCCADNDAARLAAAVIAALYHKVLLDIGTGIFYPPRPTAGDALSSPGPRTGLPPREMGADIRMICPGDGCLLCRGNLAAYGQAVEDLCRRRPPAQISEQSRSQRAGSLAALNQAACGMGMQLLGDLFAGRCARSAWARLEMEAGAGEERLALRYPAPEGGVPCHLCARAGMGDNGLR